MNKTFTIEITLQEGESFEGLKNFLNEAEQIESWEEVNDEDVYDY